MKYVRIIDTPGVIENSNFALGSYNGLKEKILGSYYGEAGSLEYGLERFLNYKTETIVYNLILKFNDKKHLLSIDYLKSFDIIFVNSINFLIDNQNLIRQLKKVSLVIVWDGIFKNYSQLKNCYHAILTCSEGIKKQYQKLNIPCYYIPFSYDDRLDEILKVKDYPVKQERCAFIGGINIGKQSHFDRIHIINKIQNNVDLFLKLGKKNLLKNLYLCLKDPFLAMKYYQIRKRNISTVYGLEYHKKILDYRGVINSHLDNITTPSNIRLFEVTGLGRVLITDRLNGLNKLFTENEEILAYSNVDELNKKIQIVKNDKDFAEYLCKNARKKTKAKYGIINRVKLFQQIINDIG